MTARLHPPEAPVPVEVRTDRLWVRPLRATDVELDYDAVMASAAQLRRWSQSDWPADGFTLAENLQDLVRHEREHGEGSAYTFTVMAPDGARCLGCVYVQPPDPGLATLLAGAAHAATVGFWVRTSEIANDLDRHLLATLLDWFVRGWSFDRVLWPVAHPGARQAALLADAGLTDRGAFTLQRGRECRVFGR